MKLKLSLFLARRYLIAKWSLMSTLSILMIAFGIITLITVLSIMNGFHNTFRRKILETNSYHMIVQPNYDSQYTIDNSISILSNNKEIISIVPYYDGEGIIKTDYVTRGFVIKALPQNVLDLDMGFNREIDITRGTFDLSDDDSIIIGEELAREAGVLPGDYISIVTFEGKDLASARPKFNLFYVSGTFKTGYWEYDKNMAYVSLDAAYRIFNIERSELTLGLKIDNFYKADRVVDWAHSNLRIGHYIYTWMDLNRPLFEALQNEKVGIGFVVMLIIVSGAFNIIGSLIMTVMDKKREIGILRAIGAEPHLITQVFVFDGLYIGFIGTVIGVFTGFLITLNIESIFNFFEFVVNGIRELVYLFYLMPLGKLPFPEFEILSDSIYYLEGVPVEIHFKDVIIVSILSLLLSVLAAYYPARKAAQLKPVENIRYE
jgi:lipoprotein-releasing system permease protein